VALDEVGAAPVGIEALVGDGDGLHRGAPARLQALLQLREIARPEAFADRLEHFDGDDVVVLAAHVAVVGQREVRQVRKSLSAARVPATTPAAKATA
jgi:hypothetical protein